MRGEIVVVAQVKRRREEKKIIQISALLLSLSCLFSLLYLCSLLLLFNLSFSFLSLCLALVQKTIVERKQHIYKSPAVMTICATNKKVRVKEEAKDRNKTGVHPAIREKE